MPACLAVTVIIVKRRGYNLGFFLQQVYSGSQPFPAALGLVDRRRSTKDGLAADQAQKCSIYAGCLRRDYLFGTVGSAPPPQQL